MDARFDKNINNVNGVNFEGLKRPEKKAAPKPEHKQMKEIPSDNGAARAYFMGGISFKGSIKEDFELPELSDKEFKEKKKEFRKKLANTTGMSMLKCLEFLSMHSFDKYNIFVAEKMLDIPKFAECMKKDEKHYFEIVLDTTNSKKSAEARCQIIDKIIEKGDNALFKDANIRDITNIIRFVRTKKDVDVKCQIMDKILGSKEEELFKDMNPQDISNIIILTETKEDVEGKCQVIDKIFEKKETELFKDMDPHNVAEIIESVEFKENADAKCQFIEKLLNNPELFRGKNEEVLNSVIYGVNSQHAFPVAERILKDFGTQELNLAILLRCIHTEYGVIVANKVLDNPELFDNKNIMFDIDELIYGVDSQKKADIFCDFIDKIKDNLSSINTTDLLMAGKFAELYGVKNINEIPIGGKRNVLRELVSANAELFKTSEAFKEMFPLAPKNQDEYCTFLPQLVKSIGIEGRNLSENEIKEFNNNLNELSNSLEKLSDSDFKNLEITQNYTKDEFISDTLDIVKDLDSFERQKVYDYFGFELKQSEHTKSGYTIIGYPKNINNGEKLAQIKDENTKRVVEELRKKVIAFSEGNDISVSGNSELSNELNGIVKAFPELRTMIGKVQNESHDFDLMKHSLKVIQGIVKNDKFKELNDSDKKLMIIAGLFHDITKAEGLNDPTHEKESAFDTSFLIERLDLNQDEEFKLYNLISNHSWLGYANSESDVSESEEKRLMDIAYDFRFDNSFDMAMIFTIADLMAVKKDNDEITNDYVNKAFEFEPKIKENIEELKKSQPLLPVTKFPKASKISEAITVVNDDGSTNIKGLYKDKKGLIVIKFNEVEDWEAIGFPRETTSKGIKTITSRGNKVDTGNIHFFSHGLEYPNQLIKFDAFSLSDSDALLSVSYAERPESKYRFFRPQGVILDCDTKYIHGGGETDSGSGYSKNIQEFKDRYISKDAERYEDRVYISNLIKKALNMTDEEYIQFVAENENKAFSEIEPKEVRDEIIKVFSEINSNIRKGNRSYNEMYISNPKPPMAVFAYEMGDFKKVGNPLKFLNRENERTEFLQDYARERDIPFVVFGE